jgi:hypothetical protein
MNTDINSQIKFLEDCKKYMNVPIINAIINSLKELKALKTSNLSKN